MVCDLYLATSMRGVFIRYIRNRATIEIRTTKTIKQIVLVFMENTSSEWPDPYRHVGLGFISRKSGP
jgi:hypothetical protein